MPSDANRAPDRVEVVPAFREAEFATAVNVELAARRLFRRGICWTPERAAEAFLGFDGAYRPASRRIWRILGQREPLGTVLQPGHWAGAPRRPPKASELPGRRTNLILQFKCSESRKGRKATFGLWTPYFRFEVDTGGQHGVLQHLEDSLPKGEAVVRYVAPAFVDRGDLIDLHLDRKVLDYSTFVPPNSIPAPHTAWAYQGPGLGGVPNPNGNAEPADEWGDLEEEAFQGGEPKTWQAIFSDLALWRDASC